MNTARIAELLQPFLSSRGSAQLRAGAEPCSALSAAQVASIASYIDLLLLWNARVNLTAVREPEAIVTRHFGESLFAARCLFPAGRSDDHLIDFGSGAGFPGLPLKIWSPELRLSLIESNHKKATFLREVVRKLGLTEVEVFSGRAEDYDGHGDVVTLRAVERFEQALPGAVRLIRPGGRLALLIGQSQIGRAQSLVPSVQWRDLIEIPLSSSRVLLIGKSVAAQQNQKRYEPGS